MDKRQVRLKRLLGPLLLVFLFGSVPMLTNSASTTPAPESRQAHEKQIKELEGMLSEYHHGKRDDNDGYVILHSLAYHYALTGSTTTAQYQQNRQEINDLIRKHPEFKTSPPSETREQREYRERAKKHATDVAAKAQQNFVPKDTSPIQIYGTGHEAVVQYQHRLDFFQLPDSMMLRKQSPHAMVEVYNESTGKVTSIRNFRDLQIKPYKVMSFRYPIQAARFGPANQRFVWVCDDLVRNYAPSDKDEYEVYGKKYPKGLHWLDENAEEKEFCGAVGLDGRILYRLSAKQHYPNTLFVVGPMSPDGNAVIISVGELIEKPDEDGAKLQDIGQIRQAIVWTYPDKVETFDVKEAAKVNAILKSHGQAVDKVAWPWPWEK